MLKPGPNHPARAATAGPWDDIHDGTGPNYVQRVADLTLTANGKPFLTLHPSRRFFPNQKVTTNDAAIHTNGFQDIYAVFADEPASGGAELRLNRHPAGTGNLVRRLDHGVWRVSLAIRPAAAHRRTGTEKSREAGSNRGLTKWRIAKRCGF